MPVFEPSFEKTSAFWLQQFDDRENKSPNNEYASVDTSPPESGATGSAGEEAVDDLVTTLKHKLQLKSPSCASLCKQARKTSVPYVLEPRHKHHRAHHHRSMLGLDHNEWPVDKVPCQLMRELLNEGSLIKEAVKRLQMKRRHSCDFESTLSEL